MNALVKHRWTEQEYLAFERASDTKHEYHDGEVYNMVGGSVRHPQIAANTIIALGAALRERPCRVFTSDLRVKLPQSFVYPDVTVVCGEPVFLDSKQDTLLNPTLVVEVLSPTTEAVDRGAKQSGYLALESLQCYLLAAQDAPVVELYARQDAASWLYTRCAGFEASLDVPVLGISLTLADLYAKVDFSTVTE